MIRNSAQANTRLRIHSGVRRFRTLYRMKHALRGHCLPVLLAAILCAAGCRTNDPLDTALRWRPNTLRTVYAPEPGFYCYAPSVIQDGTADHLFACRNREPYDIRDHIYGFTQTRSAIGSLGIMLAPAHEPGAWDCFHICDPSVVAGRFRNDDVVYRYAMFYLGNDVDASRNNQIGVAFSVRLWGPWRRHGPPIVPDPRRGTWGTGQPSAVSIDHKRRVLLFYTKGYHGAAGYVRHVDLSDATHPQVGPEIRLPDRGLTRADGGQDWLNNFDIVLDRRRNRFIAVRERHPYPAIQPRNIGAQIQVVSLAAGDLQEPDAVWKVEGEITPALTGLPRNHNAGIARNGYGELPEPNCLRVFFASSRCEPALRGQNAVWTYALHEIAADLFDLR